MVKRPFPKVELKRVVVEPVDDQPVVIDGLRSSYRHDAVITRLNADNYEVVWLQHVYDRDFWIIAGTNAFFWSLGLILILVLLFSVFWEAGMISIETALEEWGIVL